MRRTRTQKNSIKLALQIHTLQKTFIPSRYYFKLWVNHALKRRTRLSEITLRIVGKRESQQLNYHFLHKNYPTNILAFPFQPPAGVKSLLLGDLALYAALINHEAKQQQKKPLAHWAHLVIHGCLHLIGYDHKNDTQAQAMETLETQLLKELGYDNPYL